MKEQQTSVEKDHEKLLDLNWFPQTVMSPVVITTPLAERFPATPGAAVGTDRRSAVSTYSHGTIATGVWLVASIRPTFATFLE